MKAFIIEKGTPIFAGKRDEGTNLLRTEEKIMKNQAMYFLEDIVIDPLHPVAQICPESVLAEQGFYGFHLPKNPRGYEVLIVHSNYVDIR